MVKKVLSLIVLFGLLAGAGGAHAANQAKAGLTPAEQTEVNKAKLRTEQAEKEMETQKKPVFFGDKPDKQNNASGVHTLASAPNWKRKGVFFVELETSSSGSLSWAGGHAGISYNNYYTVESWGKGNKRGVQLWDNDWNIRYTHFEALTTHSTTTEQDAATADKAYSYIGKPYNYNFFNINQSNSFYCSQLVWYAYKHKLNIDLNDGGAVWPVDLTQTDKAFAVYSQ
jgi:uncharacterized protein YycO